MSKEIRIQFQVPNGRVVETMPQEATVQDMLQRLHRHIGMDKEVTELIAGYPPKSIPVTPLSATLESVGLRSGDSVRVSCRSGRPWYLNGEQEADAKDTTGPSLQVVKPIMPIQRPSAGRPLQLFSHPIPDDNSCLFRAVAVALNPRQPLPVATLRDVAANAALTDERYEPVATGLSRARYAEKIREKDTWGGDFELAVFADFTQRQIWAADVETGCVHKFLPSTLSATDAATDAAQLPVLALMFSGAHYDVVAAAQPLAHVDYTSVDALQQMSRAFKDAWPAKTQFGGQDAELTQLPALLAAHKRAHRYVNMQTFTLRCSQCRAGLRGVEDAQQHAQSTGHTAFEEYRA